MKRTEAQFIVQINWNNITEKNTTLRRAVYKYFIQNIYNKCFKNNNTIVKLTLVLY